MKILILADSSQESTRALEAVQCRDWPPGSEFLVLGVTPRRYLPPPPPSMLEVLAGDWQRRPDKDVRVRVLVQLAVEALKSNGWEARGRVRQGRRTKEIVTEARAWDADLIVVGAQRSVSVRKWLMGGDGLSWLVANAPCSVEVIREKPGPPSWKTGPAVPRSSARRIPVWHTPS